MTRPPLIEQPAALDELCVRLGSADCLAVDTEFIRERTYYPRLCLVQVASRTELACVDTLAVGDLEPLLGVLQTATITKVLHAARQDLEILVMAGASVPAPVFDTQIAADLCGFGNQTGLASLASELLGIEVDKSNARADWSKRPLADELLHYAANDVLYLIPIEEILAERLDRLGRLGWLQEDCERLVNPDLYLPNPDQAWQRVSGIGRLSGQRFHAARLLAAWRERRAMATDRPRGWVLRDELLIALAAADPDSTAALDAVQGLPRGLKRGCGDQLLDVLEQARHVDSPAPEQKTPLTVEQKRLVNELMKAVRSIAAELDVSASTLATRRDITQIVRGDTESLVLSGWRREVVGQRLLEICAGA